jgi:hypothetical protein
MKYKSKNIVIEAEQWFPGKKMEGVMECYDDLFKDIAAYAYIMTPEGKIKINAGDFIVKVEGEKKFVIKSQFFNYIYKKKED